MVLAFVIHGGFQILPNRGRIPLIEHAELVGKPDCVCGQGTNRYASREGGGATAPGGDPLPGRRVRGLRGPSGYPRRPLYRSARSSTSAILSCVARARASTAVTALPSGYRQARSRAVRAGVVHLDAVDCLDLVVGISVGPSMNTVRRPPVRPQQFGRPTAIHPFGAVQCSGRLSRHDAPAAGPQPCRSRAGDGRQVGAVGQVNVGVHRDEPAAQ